MSHYYLVNRRAFRSHKKIARNIRRDAKKMGKLYRKTAR